MNGETMEDAGEPLQISFARSQSQPPLEWMLQSSILQQAAIASFPGVVRFFILQSELIRLNPKSSKS